MTDLSPAAQAVLTASAKAHCLREWDHVNDPPCHPDDADWNGCYQCVSREGVAAALYALLQEKGAEIYDEDGRLVHFVVMQDDIRAIAAELESL